MDIIKLNQELVNCINERNKIKWALMIESKLFARLIELETNISQIRSEMNDFYPSSEVK